MPERPIDGGMATDGWLAHVLINNSVVSAPVRR